METKPNNRTGLDSCIRVVQVLILLTTGRFVGVVSSDSTGGPGLSLTGGASFSPPGRTADLLAFFTGDRLSSWPRRSCPPRKAPRNLLAGRSKPARKRNP